MLVYEETDHGFYVGVGQTQSGRFVIIDAHDHQTNEAYLIDADRPESPARLMAPRQYGHEYSIEHHGERLIITTNSGGAEDFRICETPLAAPEPRQLAGNLGAQARATDSGNHRLQGSPCPARTRRRFAAHRRAPLRRRRRTRHHLRRGGLLAGHVGAYEFDTTTLRFTYSSMTTPAQVFDYDMETRTRVLRKTQEVPSGHDAADYVTRRLYAPAGDGETVPISVLYRKGTAARRLARRSFSTATALTASPSPPAFSTSRLSLVDRGFVFAVAHIRGGKDKGYRWYTEGKHTKKVNTFTDFIAAGEFLAQQGYTRRGRIIANGGSPAAC